MNCHPTLRLVDAKDVIAQEEIGVSPHMSNKVGPRLPTYDTDLASFCKQVYLLLAPQKSMPTVAGLANELY